MITQLGRPCTWQRSNVLSPLSCQTHLVLESPKDCSILCQLNSYPDRRSGPVTSPERHSQRALVGPYQLWLSCTELRACCQCRFWPWHLAWLGSRVSDVQSLAWVSWSSSPGPSPCLFLSALPLTGDIPSSLLLILPFLCLFPPVTSWTASLVDNLCSTWLETC